MLLGVTALGLVLVKLGAVHQIVVRQSYSSSTDGRASLYAETWHRALESPIFGWGAPRPSLSHGVSVGTQGYLWTLMFSYGFVGLALFAAFLLGAISRSWRVRDDIALILHSSLIGAVAIVAVYGLDVMQWMTIGLVAAVLLRDRVVPPTTAHAATAVRCDSMDGGPASRPTPVIKVSAIGRRTRRVRREEGGTGTRRGIAAAAAVSLAGGMAGAVANLLLAVVVGRTLGTTGAGLFFQMVAVVAIASNVLELGADTGLVRFVSAASALGRRDRVRALLAIAVRPVLAAAALAMGMAWVVAPWTHLFPDDDDRLYFCVVMFAAGSGALLAVVLGAVRALGSAVPSTLVQNVGLPLSRLGLVTGCVALGFTGWRPAITAWLLPLPVALGVAAAIAHRLAPRGVARPNDAAAVRRERREFWAFSAPRAVGAAAEIGLEWADVLIVGLLATPAEAGIYAVVTRAARTAELVQQASRVAVGPALGASMATGRHDQVRRIHADVSVAMAVVSWSFLTVGAYFAPTVLGVFGAEFSAGATALRVLCVGLALSYAAGSVQSVLLMGGLSTAQLGNKVGCLVLNVALNLILVPHLGITGAALTWAICLAVDAALAWSQLARHLDLRLSLRPGLTTGVMAGAAALAVCGAADAVIGSRGQGATAFVAPAVAAAAVLAVDVPLGMWGLRSLGRRRLKVAV